MEPYEVTYRHSKRRTERRTERHVMCVFAPTPISLLLGLAAPIWIDAGDLRGVDWGAPTSDGLQFMLERGMGPPA